MLQQRLLLNSVLLALPMLVGCGPPQQSPPAVHSVQFPSTSEDAILMANKTAIEEGFRLDDYNSAVAVYDDSRDGQRWWVHFDGKRNKFGDHFSVCITEGTANAELYLGR